MNRITEVIKRILDRDNLRQSDAVKATGIKSSQFSRLLSGKITVTPENLARLCEKLGRLPGDKEKILNAYVCDVIDEAKIPVPGIHLSLHGTNEGDAEFFTHLDPDLIHDLRRIAEEIIHGDQALRQVIAYQASTIRKHETCIRAAAEDPAPYPDKNK